MTFRAGERIRETSTTTGTGTYTLAGAPTGYQSFSTLGANNTCPYFATDGTDWEVGIGTVLTSPNRLERTTILASSNSGAAVNWAGGTRTLRCGDIGSLALPRALNKDVAGTGTLVLTQNEQRVEVLAFSGVLTGNRTIEVDATPWMWSVWNNTTGDFTLTLKVTGQTGVQILRGQRFMAVCDGADVRGSQAPFNDGDALVINASDPTKAVRISAGGITTGTTRTATMPNADITLVGEANTANLTNKTLTSPVIAGTASGGTYSGTCSGTLSGTHTGISSGATIDADSNSISNIDQGNLKTATHEVSTTAGAPGTNFALNAGEWGFWPHFKTASGIVTCTPTMGATTSTSYVSFFTLISGDGSTTVYGRIRYMSSSPPYDLGDGEVALFVFVIVENATGKIIAVSASDDPPWTHNGPTDTRPDFRDAQRRGWQVRRPKADLAALRNVVTRNAELARLAAPRLTPNVTALRGANPGRDAEIARLTGAGYALTEVTQALKQADMPLVPHPFVGGNLTGRTVVMLDPVGPLTERLRDVMASGESVAEILHGDYLNVGNSPLARYAPPGVMPVAANWK